MTLSDSEDEVLKPAQPEVEQVLVANHRKFLTFLKGRVGAEEVAEDLLQSALARAIAHGPPAVDEEGIVSWFYTLLKNALTDHYRKEGVRARALASEKQSRTMSFDPELKATVCACIHELLPTIKPEYAEIVREVDLHERRISEVAGEAGITMNNATVRLHRARQALKKQLQKSCGSCAAHGCLDCSCGAPKAKLSVEPSQP